MSGNQTATCPPGFGPDILYRFPMPPYFQEPFGQDCYFSLTGYSVLGAFVILFAVVSFLLFVGTLPKTENKLLRTVKVTQMIQNLNVIAVVIMGWTAPSSFHYVFLYAIIYFLMAAWLLIYLGYHSVVNTITRVEMEKKLTVIDLVGGRFLCALIAVLFVLGETLAIISGIGISVSLSTVPQNIDNAVRFYRLLAAGLGASTGGCTFAMFRILTAFVGVINRSIASTGNVNDADPATLIRLNDMRDLSKRFTWGRNNLAGCAISAVVFWTLQATIIPAFWFMALIHVWNVSVSTVAVWYTITSTKTRRRIFLMSSSNGHPSSSAKSDNVNNYNVRSSARIAAVEDHSASSKTYAADATVPYSNA